MPYQIGEQVIRISNNNHGIIIGVQQCRGRVIYKVLFESNNQIDVLETDLRKNEQISDPFIRCQNGIFDSYTEYAKRNTSYKILNSNNSTISSLKASKTIFKPYQFKPLLKFINSPNKRLLVADEVGLGKTIEAGHILHEIKARGELRHALIVCPLSLQEKWKVELYEKFGLSFKIISNTDDIVDTLQNHIGFVRAIINYEKIRTSSQFIKYIANNPQTFSIIICDEAHKMRNKGTDTYNGAQILMDNAEAILFLTATPIMLSDENLFNLLHLLDAQRYDNYQIFHNRIQENIPFVQAISKINSPQKISFNTIRTQLLSSKIHTIFIINKQEYFYKTTTIEELYKNDPIFQDIIRILQQEKSEQNVAHLLYLLNSMSMMNNIFSRTRKREVITDLSHAERVPHKCEITLTNEEQIQYNKTINRYNIYGNNQGLGLVQCKRQIASSIWGYLNSEIDLDNNIDKYENLPDLQSMGVE